VTVTISGLGGGPTEAGQIVESFEGPIDFGNTRGQVSSISQYNEPDGDQDQYSPTDGGAMAELSASGTLHQFIEFFLGISDPFPNDIGDSSQPADGSALRLAVDVKQGDEISFDWMFDSNDVIAPPLGNFARPGFNDFAVFSANGEWFKLSDVRQTFDESGDRGASGWRTSSYEAQSDGQLTIGFAVVNDGTSTNASHLLVDNIRLNREFDPQSYTVIQSDPSSGFQTVVENQNT
jgi:hypothetical protein